MPCERPIQAFRAAHGGPAVFSRPQSHTYEEMELPCGNCILCRNEQSRQWAVRITHEAQQHETNSFVTLTYNDENLPEHSSLNYKHLRNWWRRLKREIPGIRFFAVGEYGDKTNRPHYHACIFGHDFTDDRTILRTTPSMLWTNKQLEDSWGMGNVSVGTLNFTTAQYTAGYLAKQLVKGKQYVRLDKETGELVPLVQPKSFCSKHPAIGATWLREYGDLVYAHDRVIVNGQPQKPPRFYDRWLKERSEIALGMIQERRENRTKPSSETQNRARARNAHARAKQRAKTL